MIRNLKERTKSIVGAYVALQWLYYQRSLNGYIDSTTLMITGLLYQLHCTIGYMIVTSTPLSWQSPLWWLHPKLSTLLPDGYVPSTFLLVTFFSVAFEIVEWTLKYFLMSTASDQRWVSDSSSLWLHDQAQFCLTIMKIYYFSMEDNWFSISINKH